MKPRLTGFRIDFWFLMKVLILLAMALFLVYPFSQLITRSFFSSKADGVTLYNYQRFFSRPYYVNSLKNTAYVTFLATATCTLIGVPLAYLMTRYNIWGKKVFYVFIIMALMSPTFIGAYSWILLFGNAGFGNGADKYAGRVGVRHAPPGLPGNEQRQRRRGTGQHDRRTARLRGQLEGDQRGRRDDADRVATQTLIEFRARARARNRNRNFNRID
jgi:hypothetical protein